MSGPESLEDPRAAYELAARKTKEHLGRSGNPDACTDLAASLNRRMEATFLYLKAEGAPAIDCRAGCSSCCYIPVEIMPSEAIALYNHMQTLAADVKEKVTSQLNSNADRISKMTREQHLATNVQCAFLVDQKCCAYQYRPLACASHHSLDVKRCEESFQHPEVPESDENGIPKIHGLVLVDTAMKMGVKQALSDLKLNNAALELNTAVAALVKDPSSVARWKSGYWRRLVKP